jgi:Tle cognate immunity protein 4 C-terminal domain
MKQEQLGKPAKWLTTLVVAIGVLAGCGRGAAQAASEADKRAERQAPSPERLWQSANLDFKQSAASPRECLNRQVFNVNLNAEWGVTHYGGFSGSFGAFGVEKESERNPLVESQSVNGRVANDAQSAVFIDGIQVTVLGPQFHPSVVSKDPNNPDKVLMREGIAVLQGHAARSKESLRREAIFYSEGALKAKKAGDLEWLAKDEQAVRDVQEQSLRVDKLFGAIDFGDPSIFAYARQTGFELDRGRLPDPEQSYEALVNRDSKVYYFKYEARDEQAKDPDASRKKFIDLVRAFRPRKLFEIPTERGICFPYGFIGDDGTRKAKMVVALRDADVPSVLYTMSAGWVDPERGSEATHLIAATRAAVGLSGGAEDDEVKRRLVKRVSTSGAKMGLLSASRGGAVLNLADTGKEPMWSYNVYTGYGGYANSQVLPYFIVDMRSFTKKHVPSLAHNPPPFEASFERLEKLLTSVRLRPTDPLMPELLAHPRPAAR